MNKRLAVLLAALSLYAAPAAASDLVLRNINVSIGIQAGQPHQHHKPQVVYVYDDRYRHDRRYRYSDRGNRGRRHSGERVIVVEKSRGCDSGPTVVTRPGTVVVIADGRHR
jgi:hypothetical protein